MRVLRAYYNEVHLRMYACAVVHTIVKYLCACMRVLRAAHQQHGAGAAADTALPPDLLGKLRLWVNMKESLKTLQGLGEEMSICN